MGKEDYEKFVPRLEEYMALFAKPFTTAQVRYFNESELEEARKWIKEVDKKECKSFAFTLL